MAGENQTSSTKRQYSLKTSKNFKTSKIDNHTDQSNNDYHTGQSKQRRSHRSVQNHGENKTQPRRPPTSAYNVSSNRSNLNSPWARPRHLVPYRLKNTKNSPKTFQQHTTITQIKPSYNTRRSHRPAVSKKPGDHTDQPSSTHATTSHDAAHHAVSKNMQKLAKNATKLT